jgi:hypothetical protein
MQSNSTTAGLGHLVNLVDVLKEINKTAIDIIKLSSKIVKQLEDDENDAITDLVDKYPQRKKDELSELLSQQVESLIGDAASVTKEINAFSYTIASNSPIDNSGCQFFQQIWCGDYYNKEGIDGLKDLLEELKTQKSQLTMDGLSLLVLAGANASGHGSASGTLMAQGAVKKM